MATSRSDDESAGTVFPQRRPFARLLIANRGEIAVRIIRACQELDIETVAVFSDADATALHVRLASRAIRIGPAPAAESYLRADAIIEAALASGAEAIHPGYGFLSERASFAEAVEAAGLTFVGPDHRSIAALGDKLAARRTATAAGVPVVPGTLEPAPVERPDQLDALVAAAGEVGYPLLVKAAAGGGGRGMRRVTSAVELPAALAAGSHEAASAFGDGAVYLEREIRPARHIEVQLLGDATGRVIALGERDCSLQRRHQKLVEEAPAPGLSATQRRELHEMAVRVASAAGLRNAATCEFLHDEAGRSWFLEVNTRLQVEHGVTELVAGVDIVREQLWLAAGASLSAEAEAAAVGAADPTSHAIEVRLSAEDPARGFAPAPGRVTHWVMPAGPGVRVDTAMEAGQRVPPDYDPLIAKLMVHATDRPAAIARLRRAIDETEIGGIQTTLPFDRAIAHDPSFAAGAMTTDWVDAHWDGPGQRAAAVERALLAAAHAAFGTSPSDDPSRSDDATRSMDGTGHDQGRPADSIGHDGRGPSSAWRTEGLAAGVDRWPAS